MTYGGGKPHPVGDGGNRRYEISIFDETENKRIAIAWGDDKEWAERAAKSAALRASWSDGQVKDRFKFESVEIYVGEKHVGFIPKDIAVDVLRIDASKEEGTISRSQYVRLLVNPLFVPAK